MLSACSNGPKKIIDGIMSTIYFDLELVKCIRLYNYHWLSYWKHYTILELEEHKSLKCDCVNCHVGFSPTKNEKELLMTKGITPSCKKHVVAFPKEEVTRRLW